MPSFTEPESVKKVLAIASRAAREMNLKTLDEARALSFEQSMDKGRIAFLALKEALAVYGFSIDQTLDSVKPEVLSNDGTTAKVKVGYTLLGTPLAMETELVNREGRWYGKEALDKIADELLVREVLDAEQVRRIVAGEPLEEQKVAASSSTPSPDDAKRHPKERPAIVQPIPPLNKPLTQE